MVSVNLSLEGDKDVPPEVRGWNWGAFLLTWIWGICNGTWLSLISLIPGVHFVMMFVLGAKGNEWGLRNKSWQSVEEFLEVQRKWAAFGLGLWVLGLTACILIPLGLIGWGISTEGPQIKSIMSDFAPQKRFCNYALSTAENNPRYTSYVGGKIEVRGKAETVSRENGYAEVSVPIRTPRGEGSLYLRTHKKGNEEPELERAELELKGLERMNIDRAGIQQEMQRVEKKIVELVAARRLKNEWKQRDPRGKEEAEALYGKVMNSVKQDARVKQELGAEIEASTESAKINLEGPAGDAEFKVNLHGDHASGTLLMHCSRSMGRWTSTGEELEVQRRTMPLRIIESED